MREFFARLICRFNGHPMTPREYRAWLSDPGYFKRRTDPCPLCEGTGNGVRVTGTIDSSLPRNHARDCRACHGTGLALSA